MNNIKSKIEMSNRITQTTEELLKWIEIGNPEKLKEYLQLFIIQYDVYKDMTGECNG